MAAASFAPGIFQPRQQAPEEERVHRVEEDIDDVIADGIHAPQPPLEPERRRHDGEIIRRLVRDPELIPALRRFDERIGGAEDVVVPQEPGPFDGGHGSGHRLPDWEVGNQRASGDEQDKKPVPDAIGCFWRDAGFWKIFFHRRNGSRRSAWLPAESLRIETRTIEPKFRGWKWTQNNRNTDEHR